jgi:hypothetical protein
LAFHPESPLGLSMRAVGGWGRGLVIRKFSQSNEKGFRVRFELDAALYQAGDHAKKLVYCLAVDGHRFVSLCCVNCHLFRSCPVLFNDRSVELHQNPL